MEKSKILEIANQYFEAHKNLKAIYVCDDGNVFYTEAKSFVDAHCKQNKVKETLVKRKDLKEKQNIEEVNPVEEIKEETKKPGRPKSKS